MDIIHRTTDIGADPLIVLAGVVTPCLRTVHPDGAHDAPQHRQAQGVVDGRPAQNDRSGRHDTHHGCADCQLQLAAYEADQGAMLEGLRNRRDDIMRLAWHCPDSQLSDQYRCMRAAWQLYEWHATHDIRAIFTTQAAFLATAYETACVILVKRMGRLARQLVRS